MGLWKDFKDFISKGNVIQLAVAFVMGVAFTAVVTSVVTGGITPLIGLVIGNENLATYTVNVTIGGHSTTFGVGLIINAVINFIAVALVIFFGVVYPLAKMAERRKAKEAAAPPTTKECPYCLSTIPIKASRCGSCTSQLPA